MHAAGLERPGTPHPDEDASTSTLYARANIEVKSARREERAAKFAQRFCRAVGKSAWGALSE
jgi:hypothetical protein